MTSTENDVKADTAVIEAYLDAMAGFDLDALEATLHPDITILIPFAPEGLPRVIESKAQVVPLLRQLTQATEPMRFYDIRIDPMAAPGEFIAEYRSNSKVHGTGLPYKNDYIARVTVKDGLVHRWAEYFDAAVFVRAYGGEVSMPQMG